MSDDSARLIFFWGFDKTDLGEDIVEGSGETIEFNMSREHGKEIVQVVRDRPAMNSFEDPVYCFREEVEDSGRCA
jgi:hypothetical protein